MPKENRFLVLSRRSKERYEKRIREKIPDRAREGIGNEIVRGKKSSEFVIYYNRVSRLA